MNVGPAGMTTAAVLLFRGCSTDLNITALPCFLFMFVADYFFFSNFNLLGQMKSKEAVKKLGESEGAQHATKISG